MIKRYIYITTIFLFTFLSCKSQNVVILESLNRELTKIINKDNDINKFNKDDIEVKQKALSDIIELRKEFFSKVNLKKTGFKLIETSRLNKSYTGIIFLDNSDVFVFSKKEEESTFEQTNLNDYTTNNPNDINLYVFKKLNAKKLDELITISKKAKNHHGETLIVTTSEKGKVTSNIMNTFFIQDDQGKLIYW
ncbi:hypothetical protein D1815_12675 [Aquimarina sp. AD1]|uniref:hypothetical protein n=1 Tax=Aquimarina sp. (strain AD1) TaxID=1714848 RepID=UPI000E5224D3|nr:hypothetical protein [Aquimarina sp. AD1]AXT56575.1 hypothetical protein D1815_12675 [Aquimarina sp. AD1]